MASLTGVARVRRNLQNLARHAPDEVGRAGFEEMEIEMGEMKDRTPVDTGALRASGFVNPPEVDGREIVITMGFGGPGIGYSVVVHEDLDAFHKVGQAKYAESVLDEGRPHYANRIANRVRLNRLVT